MTTLRTAAEQLEIQASSAVGEPRLAMQKRIAEWRDIATRYDSEPKTGEGRKELSQAAKAAEARRDRSLAAYHQYETASAALQIAIVLASAEVITGAGFLLWGAMGLGVLGVVFTALGFFAPTLVHVF